MFFFGGGEIMKQFAVWSFLASQDLSYCTGGWPCENLTPYISSLEMYHDEVIGLSGMEGDNFPQPQKSEDTSMIVTEVASSWLSVPRHLQIACSLGGVEL